jgi:hypothetical protein
MCVCSVPPYTTSDPSRVHLQLFKTLKFVEIIHKRRFYLSEMSFYKSLEVPYDIWYSHTMCGIFIPVLELYDVTGTGCVRVKIAQVTASGTFCFIAASSSEAGRVYLHIGVSEIVGACIPSRSVHFVYKMLWPLKWYFKRFQWRWNVVVEKVAPWRAQICTVLDTKAT